MGGPLGLMNHAFKALITTLLILIILLLTCMHRQKQTKLLFIHRLLPSSHLPHHSIANSNTSKYTLKQRALTFMQKGTSEFKNRRRTERAGKEVAFHTLISQQDTQKKKKIFHHVYSWPCGLVFKPTLDAAG